MTRGQKTHLSHGQSGPFRVHLATVYIQTTALLDEIFLSPETAFLPSKCHLPCHWTNCRPLSFYLVRLLLCRVPTRCGVHLLSLCSHCRQNGSHRAHENQGPAASRPVAELRQLRDSSQWEGAPDVPGGRTGQRLPLPPGCRNKEASLLLWGPLRTAPLWEGPLRASCPPHASTGCWEELGLGHTAITQHGRFPGRSDSLPRKLKTETGRPLLRVPHCAPRRLGE